MPKLITKLKNLTSKDLEKIIFIFSMLFFVTIGTLLTYNFDFTNNYNLLFDSDTSRVIKDAIDFSANHDRLSVHPLFILFVEPTIFILRGLVHNNMLALVILSAIVSSLSVTFIFKTINLVSKNNKLNLLLSLIYMFSFSNYVYTAGIEIYNIAALFLIILFYYFIKKMGENGFTKYSYFILTVLGVLTFTFTLTNYLVFLIVIFVLLISKKVKFKYLLGIVLASITLSIGLNCAQKLVWHNTPLVIKTSIKGEKLSYGDTKIGIDNLKNVIKDDYANSLLSSDISLKVLYGNNYNGNNYMINFKDTSLFNIIIISVFYLLLLIVLIRNFKKNFYINIGLILATLFNTSLHLIYGNSGTFLYSLHFLYLIILLFGINISKEECKFIRRISSIFLCIFLFLQFIINNFIFIKILKFTKSILTNNYLVANLGFIKASILEILLILLIATLIILSIKIIKRVKANSNSEFKISATILLAMIFLIVECLFISLETTKTSNMILLKHLEGKTGEVTPPDKLSTLEQSFVKRFEEEINSLKNYQKEYHNFLESYDTEKVSDANWSDYYFFGLGNRRKLMYKKNCLIDIETKEEIISFKEKEHLIVPNLYTVLIETTNHEYIKIYEDEKGVHISKNNKENLVDGTKTKLDLYDFYGEKYPNIKKVLYGEILFNIKDSKIYPNIIAYDKPWYRDAAITCMVLKKTNNTNLISDWISKIEDIYDMQNANEKEVDNLGELLYILSTGENIREDLVEKIENEAEEIASNNPKGYYLTGKTDFAEMTLYQNLWYKLGIESLGKKFKFNLDEIETDSYSSMAWWSDYKVEKKPTMEASKNYPYLSFATRHKIDSGKIAVNSNLYPLSWEREASQADYSKFSDLDTDLENMKISPLHSWSAAEMLLFIMDETKN